MPGSGSGSGIFKSLDPDPDPEFSNDLDPDPDPEKYFEKPGSRSKIIAPKSYFSNNTSKMLKFFFRSDPDPDPCILGGSGSGFLKSLDPDPDFVPSLDPDPALLSLGRIRIRIRPNRPGSATLGLTLIIVLNGPN